LLFLLFALLQPDVKYWKRSRKRAPIPLLPRVKVYLHAVCMGVSTHKFGTGTMMEKLLVFWRLGCF
jgi:hypothetical protein